MSDDTATIERDLEAVETALTSGLATDASPDARALQELALTLAAEAPVAELDFADELRERVDAGFPRPTKAHRRARARQARGWRAWVADLREGFAPLAGVAATILLIVGLTVVFAGGSEGDDSASGGSSAGGGGAAESSRGAADSGGVDSAEATAGPTQKAPASKDAFVDPFSAQSTPRSLSGFAPGQLNRRIERTYSMDLGVPVDDMNRVADQVNAVAYRNGGFVLSSSVDTGTEGGSGEFSLRIPTDQLRPALRDLAALAPVRSQSQTGRDVTRQHVTAKDRLQAARAERRSLLRRLEAATTDAEAEAIRRRLDIVSGEISGLRSQLRDLRQRTNYAVVNVTLTAAKKDSGSLGSLGDSFDDAGKLLAGFAGVTIRVLALALPLGLIAGLAWLAGRSLRRRRRESALA
jgi:hypothetical protein